VTPYIHKNPTLFRLESVRFEPDRSALRWTVDDPSDLEFVRAVYAALYPANPAFSSEDVVSLAETRPDIAALSGRAARNEGYAKSLAREAAARPPGE
jgi:spore coat polysaccharide biosynthesis protein SpsF